MRSLPHTLYHASRGSATPALLVVVGAFTIVIYGLLFILSLQLDFSHRQTAAEEALHIAEAGINYYRWHLAHAPEDFQDGTGGPGPYVHTYTDPQGDEVGTFSLDIIPPANGSSIVTLISTGWTNDFSSVRRTIRAEYGQPSFAEYSFLMNASSWYGSAITLNGPVHSNNGIRMDGTNNALVTSAQTTYTCGGETGCSPPQQMPGVWGAGPNTSLWQFPVPAVDFNAISFDFAEMRDEAQTNGLYLAASGSRGYHVTFTGDTVRVDRVTSTNYYRGYAVDDGCQRRYQRINNETLVGNYNVDDVPIIFAEDHVWVEGNVDGRTTVVAARFPVASNNMDIWIRDDVTYDTYDGSTVLGLIAQDDIYLMRNIPEDFQVDAAMIAQGGTIMRHGYFSWCGGSSSHNVKNSLTINGSLVSFEKSYWNFGSGPSSGFITRTINYDGNLLYAPPPYFPTSDEYEFISWREE